MAIGKVIWTPSALEDWERFCDAARSKFPNEYIESVVGFYHGKTEHLQEAHIVHLWPIRHTSGMRTATVHSQSVEGHRRKAKNRKLKWLGFLHTHPKEKTDYLTREDHAFAMRFSAFLMGSCRITGTTMLTVNPPYWLPPFVVKQHGL